jgi:ATP-dependent Zn protease
VGDILTAFLTEMDGFKSQPDRPVFVLAATNYEVEQGRARSLDAAILRRFDRKILVDLPTRPERERYIRMKASKYETVCLSDEQIENIAMRSTNMSLADLESVFELALRNSIKSKDYKVDDKCFDEAFESFNGGEEKKWDAALLERTARHEAGHALISWASGDKPSYVTVVSRAGYGGYMQPADDEGKFVYTKAELISDIRCSLAGRAAELVYYGPEDGITTGASSDLRKATKLCERMICSFGMDEKLGLSTIDESALSGPYYPAIRERVNEILSAELAEARRIIADNTAAIDELVKALMDKNQLRDDEIDEIFSRHVKK